MRNVALHLMYNGTNYHGWQVQKTEVTVAETLEKALSTIPHVTHSRRSSTFTTTLLSLSRYTAFSSELIPMTL